MSNVSIFIKNFRINDLNDDKGKQFECGKEICKFLGIDKIPANQEVSLSLTFKAIYADQLAFDNKIIALPLSTSTDRGDRKTYASTKGSHSEIKEFFLNDLKLTESDSNNYSYAFLKDSDNKIFLYVINNLLKNNFIEYFKGLDVNSVEISRSQKNSTNISLQQIFYGAPGTGKSHTIKKQTEGKEVFRTTFHPDTDYSSFVGAYKPSTTNVIKYSLDGSKLVDNNGNSVFEEKITYKFIPQSFLKAYISAWKKLVSVSDNDSAEKVYLIIEEINRGNCAQIFGDLFQLLDRGDDSFSEYPIEADSDMQKQITKEFSGTIISNNNIEKDRLQRIISGEILLLPSNLFIWATMNTSDQSLFPIDSAFKRRWDWTYVPIFNAKKNWTIEIGVSSYDWWDFLEKINEKIGALTNSEDKKLGYFFCKPNNGVISKETFVGKVIFYLWNDVFKDYEFDDDVFKDEDGQKLVFNKFYSFNGSDTIIDENKVNQFLSNLKVSKLIDTTSNDDEEVQPQEQTLEQTE